MQSLIGRVVPASRWLPDCAMYYSRLICIRKDDAKVANTCIIGYANTYSLFAEAADTCEEPDPSLPQQTHTMSRIVNAMIAYPEMLAGENHFCTSLGRTFGNHLVGKLGADGCYGLGIRAS